MLVLGLSSQNCSWLNARPFVVKPPSSSSCCFSKRHSVYFFNPPDKPILNEALKEPIAFMGGIFAGLLKLDLNEDPLREWVARTTKASGIKEKDANNVHDRSSEEEEEENNPKQIEIE